MIRKRRIIVPEEPVAAGAAAEAGCALHDLRFMTLLGAEAWARIHSEQWRVKSSVPLRRGQLVRVTARHDLMLTVVPVDDAKLGG